MSKTVVGILDEVAGGALIAAALIFPSAASPYLISAGIGMVIAGIGTLLHKTPQGVGSAKRNPVEPWNVVYGRARVPGDIVYINTFGDRNTWIDMVIVLAAHECQSVDALLFDGKRVLLGAGGVSFVPSQVTENIATLVRFNDIVTVTLSVGIAALETGDFVQIQNVSDASLNGTYAITVLSTTEFYYTCGGFNTTVSGSGQAVTTWPNYGNYVYMEALLGNQTQTFDGMLFGTTGIAGFTVVNSDTEYFPNGNPWTSQHILQGKTCVMLRMDYAPQYFQGGIPQISFLVHGKNDISDPRTSPPTVGYTENAALCTADYLANKTYGFKAEMGTEIPYPQLIAAANICDESVDLAYGGTEPRYTCNGNFDLSMKRGDILQNLLTSCGGRITYTGGQFIIWPAGWGGVSSTVPTKAIASATLGLLSTHIQGTGYTGIGASVIGNVGTIFGDPPWLFDSSAWTLRTDTDVISSATLAELTGSTAVQLYIDGTLFGDAAPPDEFLIYDCWIDLVFADGSTETLRPTIATVLPNATGEIDNPENAIDGDPSTFTTISRHHFSSLGSSPILQLRGFSVVSNGMSSPPDGSPTGIAASLLALGQAAGPFKWRQKVAIRDLYNGVKGTYISPANHWQTADIPPYAQDMDHGYNVASPPPFPLGDANLFADGGDRRWKDIQLPFTISTACAQRLCKIELLRSRFMGTGTFAFNMQAYNIGTLDIIQMTLPILGWYNKLLEVAASRLKIEKTQGESGEEVTLLGVEIDVQETDPSIYEWSTTEELNSGGNAIGNTGDNTGAPGGSGDGLFGQLFTVNGS